MNDQRERPIIAFIGDESLVVQCAAIAQSTGHEVAFVASRRDDVRGRARDHGFDTLDPDTLGQTLRERGVDVLFSIANEFVISDDVLAQVALAVNFHDGPLPDYAGLAVTTWALANGEGSHAVTWHTMTSQVDGGNIVLTEHFDIAADETAFSLNARCYEEALDTFPQVLEQVAVRDFRPQADRQGRWYGRYERPIVFVDPSTPAIELDRAVRSVALGPRIRNRVGAVRWIVGDDVVLVGSSEVVPSSGGQIGTTSIDNDAALIVTAAGDVRVSDLTTPTGDPLTTDDLIRLLAPIASPPTEDFLDAFVNADEGLARHETFWTEQLARFARTQPTHLDDEGTGGWQDMQVTLPADTEPFELATCLLVWWCRTSGAPTASIEFSNDAIETTMASLAPLLQRPIGIVTIDDTCDWSETLAAIARELSMIADRGPFLRDLIGRTPTIRRRDIGPALRIHLGTESFQPSATALVEVIIPPSGGAMRLRTRESVPLTIVQRYAEQLVTLLESARAEAAAPIGDLQLVGPSELELIDRWNRTDLAFDRDTTIDAEFRRQADLTPQAPAVSCGNVTLTYAELHAAVASFATSLQECGATRGSLVGVALDRDVDLVVAVLAILSIGAAYVPLDPDYPVERLAYMVSDSGLAVLAADPETATRITGSDVTIISPRDRRADASPPTASEHKATDLAYVIYTSGSTGRPKGVMLDHRNVVNFFAAMDEVIAHDPPGTWLAVTSLSFDISVLELLWTITRGLHVVVQKHGINAPIASSRRSAGNAASSQSTSLSLFFFAAGDAVAAGGYRLLRESAKFADEHGFEAIWVPERHFHAFGGAYPNPSVLAAAVAVLTEHVAIRAGSVVLPLHSSARVAEEWAVVDNLSSGRVGISFAPGWQPNDFVLNPGGYRTARDDLQSRIDEVRALWRGDGVEMLGPDEQLVVVKTLPRPVQPELPVWLTSAGTTKTFEKAGEMGLNLLTHLLGQSIDQLADNIAVYRSAWRAAGHSGDGRITVMLHTYLDRDSAHAKQLAEEPMKRYLGTATGLLKNMASTFPTFANAGASADEAFRSLTDSEMDELLSVATARYLDTSGLFGSVDDASSLALALSDLGVDELACLIDFGIDTDRVLQSLPMLAELKTRLDRSAESSGQFDESSTHEAESEGFADLVARHSVTHVQCTPSLAAMLMADERDQVALGTIEHLMVGGEALPEKLGRELREAVRHRFTNMYGPTETTIWSLVHEIDSPPVGPIPIGRAIGNTSLHILDPAGHRVPIGALGELHIGGEGVASGYLGQADLTAQRFVNRPGMGRVYATGDLARFHEGGLLEFAGRVDFQVKIRGHRIELGEIESQLDLHPTVDRSVVVARGDATDARLVAFVVLTPGSDLDEQLLRKHVSSVLPDVMVPDLVVAIASFPLTPNGKVDRAALPVDVAPIGYTEQARDVIAPSDDFERLVADAWIEQLHRPVGRTDNFFDLGGHSLLAVAVFRRLQDASGLGIALTDVFRYPTVASFANHLKHLSAPNGGDPARKDGNAPTGVDRGTLRRKMLARRSSQLEAPDQDQRT